MVFVGVTDPDYQKEIELLVHMEVRKSIWIIGNPLGCLLVLLCLVIKVSGKLQEPNPARMTNGSDPSEI
jgi:hypothetical protein